MSMVRGECVSFRVRTRDRGAEERDSAQDGRSRESGLALMKGNGNT